VLSRHRSHAEQLADRSELMVQLEPPPWNGPLQALARVLSPLPDEALLVLPVDMPRLNTAVLQQLIAAWHRQPEQVAVTHDGERLQPLLSVIPSGPPFQPLLMEQLAAGHRSWLNWLDRVPHQPVSLPAQALLNANRPEDLAALFQ
jgi:molybdopterin-guanine dinucleotide biosynthesis protein A